MRSHFAFLAACLAGSAFSQTPAVTESAVRLGGNDRPQLFNLTSFGTQFGLPYGVVGPEYAGDDVRIATNGGATYWSSGNIFVRPTGVHNAARTINGPCFWTSTFDGVQTRLDMFNDPSLNQGTKYNATFPGHVNNVIVRSRGALVSAWLVPGANPRLHLLRHETFPYSASNQAVPGAAKLVDFQVLPSGVSFATTTRQNGTIDFRSLFSKGGVRWTLTFPAGSQVKIDPSGHTFAAVPSPLGIEIRRFDFNANHEGTVLLPLGFGDKILSASTDPNHYFFLLTSRLENSRRIPQLVRLNPALTARMHPLPGYLATGKSGVVECDEWGQAYAVTTTTTQGIMTERLAAFDTRSFLPRWQDSRALGAGEDAGNPMTASGSGLVVWGNKPTASGQQGFTRTYAETAFRSVSAGGVGLQNGGGQGSFVLAFYGPTETDRVFNLTSNHPDCQVPATLTVPAGSTTFGIPITIPQGSTKRVMRLEAEDIETRERRGFTLVINPWVEPTMISATFVPNIVTGGTQANLRIWLNEDGKGWTIANMSSTGPEVSVPASMQLPAGKMADVKFDTLPVAARVVRRVDVQVGSVTKSDFLTIDP